MSEENISLSDEQAVEYGFAPAPAAEATPAAAPAVAETPTAEVKTETAPPAVEKPAESVSPAIEPPLADSGKTLYTPEEIEQILKSDGVLDSSRLDHNGKILQKSFQRGTTQKFEQIKRMREETEQKIAEFDRKQKEIENQKIFQKEQEELGQEEAERRKEIREIREEQQQLRWERDQAKQRELSMQISSNYRQVAPKFHVPDDPQLQDIILSSIVASDIIRVNGGEPPADIEESAARFADALGFTNVNNLWRIIKANPQQEEVVKNFYINNYLKDKAKGPTVSPSSPANVQTAQKPPVDKIDPNKSSYDYALEKLGIGVGEQIILT